MGEAESGQLLIQVKATDDLQIRKDGKTLSFPADRADLKRWLREPDPVLLIVYDAKRNRAYWIYVQAYFEARPHIDLFPRAGQVTVRIPLKNRLNRRAVKRFKNFRDNVVKQAQEAIRHHV